MTVELLGGDVSGCSLPELLGGGPVLRRRERLGVVDWAEAHHRLSSRFSSRPGPWRVDFMPHLREPLEAFEDPEVKEITLCFGSQCGKSTVMDICLGYSADRAPLPAIWCFPEQKSRNAWKEERLEPVIEASPKWRGLLSAGKKAVTQERVDFLLMPLFLALADSESDLAQKSVGLLIADEIDKYPKATAREGSPLQQLAKRKRTFRYWKFLKSSTPTDAWGAIWLSLKESDWREWFVPCLGCGARGAWRVELVRWDRPAGVRHAEFADAIKRGEEGVWYVCDECGHRHQGDRDKGAMNAAGVYHAKRACVGHAGFHVPSLASPDTSWEDWAVEWLLARADQLRGDDGRLQTFVQHELARPYERKGLRLEAGAIGDRESDLDRGVWPDWVRLVTLGVDVQGGENGVFAVALGWGAGVLGPRLHVGDWGHVAGRFESLEVQGFLDELVRRRWRKIGGEDPGVAGEGAAPGVLRDREILAGRVGLDSGDGMLTEGVYRYCRRWRGDVVRPVKGENALSGGVWVQRSKTVPGLVLVNTVALKDYWASAMSRKPGEDGAVSFARGASEDRDFVEQLNSEERQVSRTARGGLRVSWVSRPGAGGNHYWDGLVYAVAMGAEVGALGGRGKARGGRRGVKVGRSGMSMSRY